MVPLSYALMNERNVANIGQTRYPQSEGIIFMPEDTPEGLESSNVKVDKSSAEAVKHSGHLPKVEIPFSRAKVAIEVLGSIRAGQEVPIDEKAVSDFRHLIVDFAPEDKRVEVAGQVKDLDANVTILALDETISNAKIIATTREESEAEFAEKQAQTRKEKERLVEMGIMAEDQLEDDDVKPLKERQIEEQVYELSLLNKARKFKENPLTAEQIAEKVIYSEDLHGRFSEVGTLGAAKAFKDEDWGEYIPKADYVREHYGAQYKEYARLLKEIYTLAGEDPKIALRMINELGIKLMGETLNDMSKFSSIDSEMIELTGVIQLAKEELAKIVRPEDEASEREELDEAQRAYYGITGMPRIRNIGRPSKTGEESEVDKLKLTEDEIKDLRKMTIKKFNKYKEDGDSRHKEIYKALETDQEKWLFETLDKLPLAEMDLAQVQSMLAWREFSAAQSEMMEEVATYARNLAFSFEIKYHFENSGMEAMFQRAPQIQTMNEVLSKKGYGWDEVKFEIEKLISRKKLEDRNGMNEDKLRKKWTDAMRIVRINVRKAREAKTPTILEDPAEQLKLVRARFTDEEFEFLKEAAVGRFVFEEHTDGTLKNSKPKTAEEIRNDRQILGLVRKKNTEGGLEGEILEIGDSWKVGGFVGAGEFGSVWEKKAVDRTREYMIERAKEFLDLKVKDGKLGFDESEISARAEMAAFLGEWVFWRMEGRSGYWGEMGGTEKGEGGRGGEFQMFVVMGFQKFICQESKGNGDVGRVMRKLAVGADTLATYTDRFVPGMAGGVNLNLGVFDYTTQYTAINPGERNEKQLSIAGFVRGHSEWFEDRGICSMRDGHGRLMSVREKISSIQGKFIGEVQRLADNGVDNDSIQETIRNMMSDEDKNFFEELNNLPVATFATTSSRDALVKIASGEIRPWGEMTDFLGSDFKGPNEIRQQLAVHDSGFLSKPDARMLGVVAQLSEGRKRVWQRAKLMKDMASMVLDFKSLWNKKITGRNNWNAEDADTFLTDARDEGLIIDRSKKVLERDYYRKVVDKGLARLIPFADTPFIHKLSFIYAKKPVNIGLDTILAMILEFFKRFPSQMTGR